MTDVVCAVACTVAYPDHHMDLFTSFLQDEYRVEMFVPSLPHTPSSCACSLLLWWLLLSKFPLPAGPLSPTTL